MWNHQTQARSAHVALANEIKTLTGNQGSALINPEVAGAMLSFESAGEQKQIQVIDSLRGAQERVKGFLADMIADPQLGFEGFGGDTKHDAAGEAERRLNVAAQAAAVVLLGGGDVTGYARKAYTVESRDSAGVRNMPLNDVGSDFRLQPAMESFDEKELSSHLPYSAVFAAFGSRQDEFTETFFPTAVITPDQAGLDIEVTIPKVFTNGTHPAGGQVTDFGKQNLIDAVVDADILKDEATRLIPFADPNGSNDAVLVSEDQVATHYVRQGGYDAATRPLKVGVDIGLISVSNFGPLLSNGVMTNTDAVDNSVVLESVYLGFAADAPAVKFNTLHMPRNRFTKTVEGNYKETQLTFVSRDLVIDGTKKASDGTDVAAFAAIAANKWKVYLRVSMQGVLNVEFGSVNVNPLPVKVDLIVDETGKQVSHTTGAGKTLADLIEAGSIVGYDLKANRTNSNLRTRGHVVDVTKERERHTLPLGSPITYPSPVHETGRDGDIKLAVNASRIRNSNLGTGALISYGDALEQVVKGPKRADGLVPGIAGAGRWVVQPWFERRKLDVSASMTSEKSIERAGDIALTVINAIRDMAYRAYQESRYQAALDAATQGSGEKPMLIIGTDSIIERHLMLAGDDRTFGTAFEKFKIVSSLDKRVYGKIFITFTRGAADPSDVLSFGTHAWMPELTSTLPINRQGATYREAMVQPRNLHVPKLPILGIIEVEGLSKALVEKTPVLMVGPSDITNPWLPAP